MTQRGFYLAVAVCVLAAASPASAKGWIVDYAQSHVGFTGTQSNDKFDGCFKKFSLDIDFDPAKPESGNISAAIDMASAFAGSSERDKALPQSEWLDTSKFPQALFATTKITAAKCDGIIPASPSVIGCYQAEGMLVVKGVTKNVSFPFSLTKDAASGNVHAQGKVPLNRTDFKIGQGQWLDEAIVKYSVDVTLDIIAKPAS